MTRGRPRIRIATAVAAAALCALLATAASAHHGEPATGEDDVGTLGAQNTGGTLSTDFENFSGVQTPVAKDGAAAGWQQIAGSLWREDGTITDMARPDPGLDSPTPYDLDFYGLGFLKVEIAQNAGLSAAAASNEAKANGFAVGAQCRRSDPAQPVPAEEVPGCERVPVIYRYQDHPTKGLIWEQSYPSPDDKATDPGGFVAAVAWLTPNRALAVGGTGTYPRREVERVPGEPDDAEGDAAYAKRDACQGLAPGEPCRGAGMARAWIFERDPESADPKLGQGTWRELQNKPDPAGGFTGEDGDEIPDEMRALHAIDASPRPADCLATLAGTLPQAECAIAGGMRQLWHFADGRLVRGYGPELGTPPGEGIFEGNVNPIGTSSAANFRFRVRDIRFAPQTWRIGNEEGTLVPAPAVGTPSSRAWAVTSGCCSADTANDRPARLSLGASGWSAFRGGPRPVGVNSLDGAVEQTLGRSVFNPDSYYALTVLRRRDQGKPDQLADFKLRTPGGPSEHYDPREPPSRFTCYSTSTPPNYCDSEQFAANNERKLLSSLRLVSADGDMAGSNPDGVPDWAIGVLRSSGRGVAYSTVGTPCQAPGQDELLVATDDEGGGIYSLGALQAQRASKNLCSLPSYALNAYRVAGEDPLAGDEGTGWAVGDHGAIATRGGGVAGVEAPPARQGTRSSPQPLSRDAFDRHRPPPTEEPGPVPALAPGTVAVEPGFTGGQTPSFSSGKPAKLIVMSRDGSRGWAFGTDAFGMTIYRYDGLRWTICDPTGIANLIPPDPACAELPAGVSVKQVVRVPLERDSDPTNDEELEALALAGSDVYRYRGREGRWARDEKLSMGFPGATKIAFTAPDDGWAVRTKITIHGDGTGGGSGRARPDTEIEVWHFDGKGWSPCTRTDSVPAECADPGPDRRLPIQTPCKGATTRFASAGERVYLYTTRDARPRTSTGSTTNNCFGNTDPDPYPVILYRDAGKSCVKSGDPGCWRGGTDTTDDGTYNPTDGGWDPGCIRKEPPPTPEVPECVPTAEPTDKGSTAKGRVDSLSVAQDADGSFQGWAIGAFGGVDKSARALMMRLSDGHDVPGADDRGAMAWRSWTVRDAADDYLRERSTELAPEQQLTLPAGAGQRNAFMFLSGRLSTVFQGVGGHGRPPALAFDQVRRRWVAIPTPWQVSNSSSSDTDVHALAPDGRGGFWAAGRRLSVFHHYTDRAPKPVFSEVSAPTAGKARITALGAGADGTVWLGDANGGVYRYDRLAGWSARVEIPGWDPARATRRAPVSAIAVGPEGSGVAAGPGGRIAQLGERVGLDPAATIACDPQVPVPPCGRGSDLLAAAVAPDGSAIVAGEKRTLLWRPAGGDFRPIAEPRVPAATPIIDVEMPSPERAYLLTQAGHANTPASRVIRGEMSAPGQWSWSFEVGDSGGTPDPLTAAPLGNAFVPYLTIRDIAVDASGHGYAVGDTGLVLERSGDGESPWRRVPIADQHSFQSVALPEGGGEGALIGGGPILTLSGDRFEVARHTDPFDPANGSITELALTPGYAAGEAEAWALEVFAGTGGVGASILHYPADPTDPRLDPDRGLAPLPDSPGPTPGEISFAAFGKQDCDMTFRLQACGPPDGANVTVDLVNRRIREELVARSEEDGAPQFALFSGDAVDAPGGRETARAATQHVRTPLDLDLKHRRWVELVPEPLADQGLPTFGAIGGQDLARDPEWCTSEAPITARFGTSCPQRRLAADTTDQLGASVEGGSNLPWRTTMASMPAPWEGEQEAEGLRFERVTAGALSQRGPEAGTPDSGNLGAESATIESPGFFGSMSLNTNIKARVAGYRLDVGDTHYAVDAIDETTDEKVARIVVVDTSMGSIAASDPQQHPIEAGGQLRWLEEVLCFDGSAEDTDGDVRDCTREPGQQAIVVSNTPTYSYGPISPEETQTDAAAFEAILLKNQVNVVVSGRLGWNGRYWAVAPGVHAPCPGQDYRSDSDAPSLTNVEVCGASAAGGVDTPDPGELIQGLPDDAKQAAGLAGRSAIPFVVSSTAGGRFNTKAVRGGFATAESGFWRGYSIVRLSPDGDPAKTIVEQRPILDWVGLAANDPSVAPGQRLQLESYAREAFGMDTAPRYYEIPETQVITHRYHLLLVHPDEPWRACEAGDSECEAYYSKLAEGPRSFDSAAASGSGSAQDDNSSRMSSRAEASRSDPAAEGPQSASATSTSLGGENPCDPYLCLPERIGTIDPDTGAVGAGNGKYPDTFAIATLSVGRHVAAQPLVFTKSPSFVVSGFAQPPELPSPGANLANAPTAPAPPPAPKPPIPQVNTPEPPLPPAVPPIAATQPPEPQPPAPPAPPPPTDQPSPLNLTLAPPGITVATPTAVIQPPTPPVNPAPPGGARREARQRQAAAQKSGADSEEQSDSIDTGDLADSPMAPRGAPMTRRDRTRPEPSFTAIARADQPSAWAQGLLYGGGITIAALALAAGFTTLRPGPRRRSPEAPAPAWSRLGPPKR